MSQGFLRICLVQLRESVEMDFGLFAKIPNAPIQKASRRPNLCACHHTAPRPIAGASFYSVHRAYRRREK